MAVLVQADHLAAVLSITYVAFLSRALDRDTACDAWLVRAQSDSLAKRTAALQENDWLRAALRHGLAQR